MAEVPRVSTAPNRAGLDDQARQDADGENFANSVTTAILPAPDRADKLAPVRPAVPQNDEVIGQLRVPGHAGAPRVLRAAAPAPVADSGPYSLAPDSWAYGATTSDTWLPFGIRGAWILSPSGNPFNFSETNGNSIFISVPASPPPANAGPVNTRPAGRFGSIGSIGQGGVLTYNPATKRFEAGWGGTLSLTLPGKIPALVWLNFRTNDLPPDFNGTVSGNLGVAVSVDQLAARGLEIGAPAVAAIPTPVTEAAAAVMAEGAAQLELLGKAGHGFFGAGYRVELRFEHGVPVGIYRKGQEIADLKKFAEDVMMPMLARREAPNKQCLLDLGMTPEAADILAPFLLGHDVKSFLEQTADHINDPSAPVPNRGPNPAAHPVRYTDLVNWFNKLAKEDPEWLKRFAAHGIGAFRPDADGKYSRYLWHRNYSAINIMQSIADMVRDAAALAHPMPTEGSPPAQVPAPPPAGPPPPAAPAPPARGTQFAVKPPHSASLQSEANESKRVDFLPVGSFVKATGGQQVAAGRRWIEVTAGRHTGWVLSDSLEEHAQGDQYLNGGRYNRKLEEKAGPGGAYYRLTVRQGDNLWEMVRRRHLLGHLREIVADNSHIPGVEQRVRPGDIIYIRKAYE